MKKVTRPRRRKTATTAEGRIEAIIAKLDVIKTNKGGGMALCPAHDDNKPSLSFQRGKKGLLFYCHAGCTVPQICEALGNTVQDLLLTRQHPTATYLYHDANGDLQYEVIRYDDPKAFRQRRPDGKGGHIWNLKDTERLPYRRPELNGQEEVFIVEGEKDVDCLVSHGAVATCNSGGAGKWDEHHTQHLVDAGVKRVNISPDNDPPGHEHAVSVARSCQAAGMSVKIVALPDLPPKGDVSDWFDAGNTFEQLRALVESMPEWVDARPPFDCTSEDLTPQTEKAWALVTVQQRHAPTIYVHGTVLVRAELDEHGCVRLVPLTEPRLRLEVGRHVMFTRTLRGEEKVVKPPYDLIRSMLATPSSDMQLPQLRGIIEVPVVSRGGVLVLTPGYDPVSQLLYRPYDPTADLSIPMQPTEADLMRSCSLINEVLIDFPFVSPADHANVVGLMFTPFVRPHIDGPTPLYLAEAPAPGSGKGLLVTAALTPAVGTNIGVIPEVRNDDELRKNITARLMEGRPVTLFDNVTHEVNSSALSAALTSVRWEDRMLGKTETLHVPNNTVWTMTANNPVLHTDIARRTVRIRLDPKVERPWTREGFRHPNLLAWVKAHRAELIRAILTIIQGWLHAGQPPAKVKPLGSFEDWTRVVGGILAFAGYEQFLGNALEMYAESDAEGEVWRAFTAEWWALCQDKTVSVKDLIVVAERVDFMDLGRSGNERSQRTSLGMQLKKKRDAIVGPYRIEMVGVTNNAATWRLRLIDVGAVITVRKKSTKFKAKY